MYNHPHLCLFKFSYTLLKREDQGNAKACVGLMYTKLGVNPPSRRWGMGGNGAWVVGEGRAEGGEGEERRRYRGRARGEGEREERGVRGEESAAESHDRGERQKVLGIYL